MDKSLNNQNRRQNSSNDNAIVANLQIYKNFPTYPWNIPQTQNQQFMKEFLSFGGLGRPGWMLFSLPMAP